MFRGASLSFNVPTRTWSTSKAPQSSWQPTRPSVWNTVAPSLFHRSFAKTAEKPAEPKKGNEPSKDKKKDPKGDQKQAGKGEEKPAKKEEKQPANKVAKKEEKEQKEGSVVRQREPFIRRRELVQLIKGTKAINRATLSKKYDKGLARYEELLSKKLKPTKITNYVMLKLYSRKGDFENFEKVYQEVLAQAPKLLEPRRIYMTSYAPLGEVDKLEACLQKLEEDGLKPDESIFEQLMIGYGKKGDLDKVKSILEQMPAKGVQPTIKSHTALLSSLGGNGKHAEMMEHFKKIKKSTLNLAAFMTVLRHLAQSQDVPQMMEVFDKMYQQNVWPTTATYDLLLDTLAGKGDLEGINTVFKRMTQEKVKATAKIFSTVVYANGKELGKPKIDEMFKLAKGSRINAWPEVGNAALRAYAHRGEKENFEALYKTREGKKPVSSTIEIVKEHYPELLEKPLSIPVGTLAIEGQTVEGAPILTEGQNAESAPTEAQTEPIEDSEAVPTPTEAQATSEAVAQ